MSLSYHRGRDMSNLKIPNGAIWFFPMGKRRLSPKRGGSAAEEGCSGLPRRPGACRPLRLWDGGAAVGTGAALLAPLSRGGLASPAGRSRPSLGLSARGGFFSLAGADSRLWAASRPSPSPWERPPRAVSGRRRRWSRLLGGVLGLSAHPLVLGGLPVEQPPPGRRPGGRPTPSGRGSLLRLLGLAQLGQLLQGGGST